MMRDWHRERAIVSRIASGEKQARVAADFGITRSRVGQIWNRRRHQRSACGQFGIGDYVTRGDGDVQRVDWIGDCGDVGVFVCVVEPQHEAGDEPWCRVGESEENVTRRYSAVDYTPQKITHEES